MKSPWLFLLVFALAGCGSATEVKIGSKVFTEAVILGEMVTLLARSSGVPAKHVDQLGGTQILWQALQEGSIDAYVDYTGTISDEILQEHGLRDEAAMRQALAKRGVFMSRPLGFSNTYALGMREETAERLHIRKISDLRGHPDLKFGFSNEFMERRDGWPGLRQSYGLPQQNVRGMEHTLAYAGLKTDAIQVTDLYSTDGEIIDSRLRVLQDDQAYFPPYYAVLLYRIELVEREPKALAAMLKLEGRITENAMIEMNALAQNGKMSEGRIAADFLAKHLGIEANPLERNAWQRLLRHSEEHLLLVACSLVTAILVAVPLGILAFQRPRVGQIILGQVGTIQTIPYLALLVFLIPLFGMGAMPAIVTLFLYSLLPIVRNTYSGLHDIPTHIRESAEAVGLFPFARLRLVELPMASRSILAGIKTSAVINVGNATLGGVIGAGGFGEPIMTGLRRFDLATIVWEGAFPAAVMAVLVQMFFDLIERLLVPKGLRLKPGG